MGRGRQALRQLLTPTRFDASGSANIVNDLRDVAAHRAKASSVETLLRMVEPLLATVECFGKAMDVFVNAVPEILSPAWEGLRVLLLV